MESKTDCLPFAGGFSRITRIFDPADEIYKLFSDSKISQRERERETLQIGIMDNLGF